MKTSIAEINLKHFNTKTNIIDQITNSRNWFEENFVSVILTKLEHFTERDSGWVVFEIMHRKIN